MKYLLNAVLFFYMSLLSTNLEASCLDEEGNILYCLVHQINFNTLPGNSIFEPISYCELEKIKKERNFKQEWVDFLIDYAYTHHNPILFREAKVEIPDESYSLNFLWINKEKLKNENHFLGNDDDLLNEKVINPILDWRTKQPDAYINFWYDEEMVSNEGVINTKKMLADAAEKFKIRNLNPEKINFRSIRKIPTVINKSRLFEQDISVYYRVDLSKALIADYLLRTNENSYTVNIDADIVGITKKQLFDEKTLEELNILGYTFGSVPMTIEENSFIILYNEKNKLLLEDHKEYVIDKSIDVAEKQIKKGSFPPAETVYYKYAQLKLNRKDRTFYGTTNKNFYQSVYSLNYSMYGSIGKAMIFPKSIHGSYGYKQEQILTLKQALLTNEGCQDL